MRLLATLALAASCAAPMTAASSPSAGLTLHWMSQSRHDEPRYWLLYEGGGEGSFTQLRLVGPDAGILAMADAVASAGEPVGLCFQNAPGRFGAVRATLNVSSQDAFSDFIRRPEAYRVEALSAGSWVRVVLVNECYAQE